MLQIKSESMKKNLSMQKTMENSTLIVNLQEKQKRN